MLPRTHIIPEDPVAYIIPLPHLERLPRRALLSPSSHRAAPLKHDRAEVDILVGEEGSPPAGANNTRVLWQGLVLCL